MKKYILLLIAIIAFFPAYTQENPCIPDVTLQDSTFGLWPDTIQNLPIAQKDTYYEANIQIKTPATVGEVMGSPYEIPNPISEFLNPIDISPLSISDISLVDVIGLPIEMMTYLSNSDSTFNGDDVGCVTLYGTPEQVGVYDIELYIDGTVSIPGLGSVTLYEQLEEYEVIDGYRLIVQSDPVSIEEVDKLSFYISQNIPNPFTDFTTIEFYSKISQEYIFRVYNILGETQEYRTLKANRGINKIDFNANFLLSGIYFYSLSNSNGVLTKKMIVQ